MINPSSEPRPPREEPDQDEHYTPTTMWKLQTGLSSEDSRGFALGDERASRGRRQVAVGKRPDFETTLPLPTREILASRKERPSFDWVTVFQVAAALVIFGGLLVAAIAVFL